MILVGVSGHRPNRMPVGFERVAARLRAALCALRRGCGIESRPVALTALAEGSDRLFAQAALELGYDVHAVLPFRSADYETTFGDGSATPVYHALLARCSQTNVHDGSLADAPAAYEATGRQIVDDCGILFAVWDGKPSAGRGGTPEIMQYALDIGRTIIWINSALDRPPHLLKAPNTGKVRKISLENLALRAKPISPRKLAALGSCRTRRHGY